MGVESAIDITIEQRETILALFEEHLPDTAAWIYGSRVTWTSRPQSDLDLVVFSTPEQIGRVGALREAFEESNLPFRVDLFVWDDVPEAFREQIQAEHVVIAAGRGGITDGNCQRMNGPTKPRHESRLGEVAELVMGQSPPGSTYNEVGDGLPFFQGVKDFNYRHPTPRVFCSAPTRIAQPGDILFSVRAPIGRVNVADRECAIGRGLSIIRPRVPSDARYLEFALWYLESEWDVLESGGSVFGNATKRDLKTLPLPWPSDEAERSAIAQILGTLDDKIELNRRMNETLEAMAQAVFKSWFVDFDPVRAKRKGRDPDLPKHLADLFPDQLVECEPGEAPKGWILGTVSQLAGKIHNGGTPRRSEPTYWECGKVPWLTSSEVRQSFVLDTKNFITEKGLSNSSARIIPERSILVALYGATAGQVCMNYRPLSTNQAVSAIIPSLGNRYFCLESLKFRVSALENSAVGSAQQNISKKVVEETVVLLPPLEIRVAYDIRVERLYDLIFNNLNNIRVLTGLRDNLLSKLVSGELQVLDAKRKFAEAIP